MTATSDQPLTPVRRTPGEVRVFIGPTRSVLFERAVEQAGGVLVDDPAGATAIIWRNGDAQALRTILHAGVSWVQLVSVGIDNWLASGLVGGDVVFTSAAGCFGRSVAEHALALVLACGRRLKACAQLQSWDLGPEVWGTPLPGSTVAVVGTGDIGSNLLRMLRPLGARLVAVNRSGHSVPDADEVLDMHRLDDALAQADYVVLSLPSTPETVHLLDEHHLRRMKKSAWLINVGRGDVVATNDLVAALREGVLAGAALDVTDPEPLPDGHPLWTLPRVLLTPHVANPLSVREESLAGLISENVALAGRGERLRSIVDPVRGY